MQRRAVSIVLFAISSLLCACTARPIPTLVPGMAQTLAVRTLAAKQGVEFFATCTPTQNLFSQPNITSAQQRMYTQPPTNTPIPSLTPFSNTSFFLEGSDGCTDLAEFIRDVTINDDTKLKPGASFTKIWEVKNVGTCTWTQDYALVFTFGDRMSGMTPKLLNQEVKPGEIIQLSIDLVAPTRPDDYRGNWMLQDSEGNQFGTGYAARDFFWVSITIGSPNLNNIFGGGGCSGGG